MLGANDAYPQLRRSRPDPQRRFRADCFLYWVKGGAFRVSTLGDACVLCALGWRRWGKLGAGRLGSNRSRPVVGPMQQYPRRRLLPPSASLLLELDSASCVVNSEGLGLSWPLQRVSMTLAASHRRARTRLSPHFKMLPT
jgi:hypothetical protein